MKTWILLHTISEWEELKQSLSSASKGLILFKFSPTCPRSRSIERKFDAWYQQLDETIDLRCAKIDVIHDRPLSRHIAEELQITHESPQAIWLTSDAGVYWHASHEAITPETLTQYLQQLAPL